MSENLSWEYVNFESITLPPTDLIRSWAEFQAEYVIDKTEAGKKEKASLTREASLYLAQLHPMLIWGKKRHCVCGIRTLTLISPCLSIGDQIPVAILPNSTNQDKLKELIQADALLTHMAFSLKAAPSALFSISRQVHPENLKHWSPALADGIQTCSKLLGVSPPTLYKHLPQTS